MAKKNDGIIWHLMDAPWRLSLIVAAIVYISLSIVLPTLAKSTGNMVFDAIAPNLSLIAPYLAFLFLIPALIAFIKQFNRRRHNMRNSPSRHNRTIKEPDMVRV